MAKYPLAVVNCDDCGECCVAQGTPPFSHTDGDRPPDELKWDINEHALRYDYGLPCLWFNTETKRCNHYEHRPDACRSAVVPGDEFCLHFRDKANKQEEK